MAKISEYRLIAEAYDRVYASGANNYPQVLPLLEKGKNLLFIGSAVSGKNFLQQLALILKNYNGNIILVSHQLPIGVNRMFSPMSNRITFLENPTNQQLIQLLDDNTKPVVYMADEGERFPQVILNRMELITSKNHPGADKGLISNQDTKEHMGRDMDEIRSSLMPR